MARPLGLFLLLVPLLCLLPRLVATPRLRRSLLLALFVLVDTGQAFITDWAEGRHSQLKRRYVRQSVLVLEAFIGIIMGISVQWLMGGLEAVRQCFDLQKTLEFAPNCRLIHRLKVVTPRGMSKMPYFESHDSHDHEYI